MGLTVCGSFGWATQNKYVVVTYHTVTAELLDKLAVLNYNIKPLYFLIEKNRFILVPTNRNIKQLSEFAKK